MDKYEYEATIDKMQKAQECLMGIERPDYASDFSGTLKILSSAIAIHRNMLVHELGETDCQKVCEQMQLDPCDYLERIYETYLGMTSDLEARFDLDYLLGISPKVLMDCMPVVRRADFLNEIGMFTSVAVTKSSIVVPVMQRDSKKVFLSDIKSWRPYYCVGIYAPCGPLELPDVDQAPCGPAFIFDNIVADLGLQPFVDNTCFPAYNNPESRYYDKISGHSGILKGYKICRN